MIEQEYLKYCLEKIEGKLGWKPSSDWKESDFVRLSEMITEKSHISISPHTLKRLFGKIKYKKYYNPQQATKDALAKYLEFSDWQGFVADLKKSAKTKDETEQRDTQGKKRFLVVAAGVVLIVVMAVFLGRSSNSEVAETNSKEVFNFSLEDSVGVVPYTVSINYDVSNIKSDSTIIDFGFNHPIRGRQSFRADKNKFMRNFTYQIPGKYFIELENRSKILDTKTVLVMSDDWESYFNPEIANGNFWIDSKIEKKKHIGSLYYPPKFLDSIGFDTKQVYYVTNRLYKEFDIDGDNFELNTKFKSSETLGGITCYDFILRVISENNNNEIKLMENGCSQFSGIRIGEKEISGGDEDLSSFKFKLGMWNDLKITVNEKSAEVRINNNQIFTGNYDQANGKIIGLEVVFKGTGMLDFINIKDLNSQKVYNETFN